MIEILKRYYDDEDYDACGSTTYAVLKINGIKIPLCSECVNELTESLTKFNNTVFCHKCKHYIMNQYGLKYDGTCKKKAEQNGDIVTEDLVGFKYPTGYLDTCDSGELKEG